MEEDRRVDEVESFNFVFNGHDDLYQVCRSVRVRVHDCPHVRKGTYYTFFARGGMTPFHPQETVALALAAILHHLHCLNGLHFLLHLEAYKYC